MRPSSRRLVLVLACAIAGLVLAQSAPAAVSPQAAPVPSLEPQATQELWQQLVRHRTFRPYAVGADCRPLRAVFYAATDWLRLATKLAAAASPCAQYYVSVPPVVADKTKPRPDQAWRIRALGPNVHALAEIHFTAWQKWVTSTGSGWYQAGVEARRRMASAGYDVAAGDTWALNELSSAVRRGDGTRRSDVRDFLRGLYDAAGEGPPTRGVVWIVGVGQRVPEIATYKARMQEWLQDSAFWVDMNAYVSDWSQEVYADVRGYAAPGAAATNRRDALVDYLRHSDLLALAGGAASGTANAFFANAGSALANAAWQWGSAFGWTLVPVDLMQQFVSAEVYALRNHGARSGRPSDRFGFAWAPRNSEALLANDFTRQTGAVLDRLAAAIRDSAATTADPGVGACGANGQNTWCAGDLDGATLTDNWRAFRAWSPTTLAFVSAPQAVGAGVVSAPVSFQVQVAGVAGRPMTPVAATLTSSSPTGDLRDERHGTVHPDRHDSTSGRRLRDRAGLLPGRDSRHGDPHGLGCRSRRRHAVAHRHRRRARLAASRSAVGDAPPGSRGEAHGHGCRPVRQRNAHDGDLDGHAGDARQPHAGLRPDDDVHRGHRSGLRPAHRDGLDPRRAALRIQCADRCGSSARPRGRDPVRRREADAARVRHGRRQSRPTGT